VGPTRSFPVMSPHEAHVSTGALQAWAAPLASPRRARHASAGQGRALPRELLLLPCPARRSRRSAFRCCHCKLAGWAERRRSIRRPRTPPEQADVALSSPSPCSTSAASFRRHPATAALPAACSPTCQPYRWSVCHAPNSGHHSDPPPSVRHPVTSPSSPLYPTLPARVSRAQTASNFGRQGLTSTMDGARKSPCYFRACSVGWWLMAGVGLFWENSTAGWLRLVADGWFVLREKYCWLVADKPSEHAWVLGKDVMNRLDFVSCIFLSFTPRSFRFLQTDPNWGPFADLTLALHLFASTI
jgi:hypothetical protein